MKRLLVILLIVLIVFCLGYLVYDYMNKENSTIQSEVDKKLAYVTLDINPSIELVIDENDKVVDTVTLNEDADIAYSDVNLIGKTIEDATESIVDTAIDLGYITEISDTNAVNVTSYAEDDTRRENLNKKIVSNLNNHFEVRKFYILLIENGLDEELKTKAESYDIAYGKMLLISRAMQLDTTLVESDLVNLSVKEIQSKIKTVAVARREEVKLKFQEGKQEFKDIKEQKINEAKVTLQQGKEALLKGVENFSSLTAEEKQAIINQRKQQIKNEIQDVKENLKQNNSNTNNENKQNIRQKYFTNKK